MPAKTVDLLTPPQTPCCPTSASGSFPITVLTTRLGHPREDGLNLEGHFNGGAGLQYQVLDDLLGYAGRVTAHSLGVEGHGSVEASENGAAWFVCSSTCPGASSGGPWACVRAWPCAYLAVVSGPVCAGTCRCPLSCRSFLVELPPCHVRPHHQPVMVTAVC